MSVTLKYNIDWCSNKLFKSLFANGPRTDRVLGGQVLIIHLTTVSLIHDGNGLTSASHRENAEERVR